MDIYPSPRNDDETLDDIVGSALLTELSRLLAEISDRVAAGEFLAVLGSVQAAGSRCEDFGGWVQRLIARQAQFAVDVEERAPAAGAYL